MPYRFFNGSVRYVGRKKVDLCSARAPRSLRLLDAECNNQPKYTQECRSDQSIAEPGNDSVCRRCRTRGPDWHRIKSGGDGQEYRQTQGETDTLRSGDQPGGKTFLPGLVPASAAMLSAGKPMLAPSAQRLMPGAMPR